MLSEHQENELAEAGGPTTQSGIFYQNSIAALYLGALLDLRQPVGRVRVQSVRIEAPEHIDDIVVNFHDGSTLFIQAKEHLDLSGEPWTKFWAAVQKQAEKTPIARGEFRLVVGNLTKPLENLREALDRASGKSDCAEWLAALSKAQAKIARSILAAIALPLNDAFAVISRVKLEFLTLRDIETTGVRDWMPSASVTQLLLFSNLRDCCGGAARIRATFLASELSEALLNKYSVRISGSHGSDLEKYRQTIISQFDHIVVPGTSVSSQQDKLLIWPTITTADSASRADFEDEDLGYRRDKSGQEVSLRDFATAAMRRGIVESGAGHGKTTLLKATARRLAMETTFVPAFLTADGLQSCVTVHDYLNSDYNGGYQVAVDWLALSEQSRAALIIDGIDELSDAARASVLAVIERTAARFPMLPILIGARDASVAGLPTQFKLYRIQRLDQEQMISMLEAYVAARPELSKRNIIKHVLSHQDLGLLCRIPLFLSIFVAAIPANGKIPASRTEVLERYISHVLSPERHKAIRKSSLSKTQLRRGAEALALLALERNETALPETNSRACLAHKLGSPAGDDCTDTLIQFGLLQRRGARLAFSIPTVQEYLAACVLVDDNKLASVDWTNNVYRRPWAQAIQFAVEKLEDSEELLRRQLGHTDDLFATSLRIVARCIANGASVTASFRDTVAAQLAHVWAAGVFGTRQKVGNLIADGFSKPPHRAIRRELLNGKSFVPGRPEIIYRANEADLTLHCLKSILEQDDIREIHWHWEWHESLKPVAVESIALLIKRARQETTSTLSANVVAEVLYQLRKEPGDVPLFVENSSASMLSF